MKIERTKKTIAVALVKMVTYTAHVEVDGVETEEEARAKVHTALSAKADEQQGLHEVFGDAMSPWEQEQLSVEIDRTAVAGPARPGHHRVDYYCVRCMPGRAQGRRTVSMGLPCSGCGDFTFAEVPAAAKEEPDRVYACSECGCIDLQAEAWASLNDNKLLDYCEGGDNWCPECEEHQKGCCLIDRATGECEFHPGEQHPWKLHPYEEEPMKRRAE